MGHSSWKKTVLNAWPSKQEAAQGVISDKLDSPHFSSIDNSEAGSDRTLQSQLQSYSCKHSHESRLFHSELKMLSDSEREVVSTLINWNSVECEQFSTTWTESLETQAESTSNSFDEYPRSFSDCNTSDLEGDPSRLSSIRDSAVIGNSIAINDSPTNQNPLSESAKSSRGTRSYTFKKRKRRKTSKRSSLQTRRVFELERMKIADMSQWVCCKLLLCFKNANVPILEMERETVLRASQECRKAYLTRMLRKDKRFYFDNKPVCSSFLSRAFGFSKDLQRTVKCTARAPAPPSIKRAPRVTIAGPQRDLICKFLQGVLARAEGCSVHQLPEKSRLPFPQKKEVYSLLLDCIERGTISSSNGKPAPTFSYFISVWNEHFQSRQFARTGR